MLPRGWVLLAVAVSSCGRGDVSSTGSPTPVLVSPASVNLPPGAQQRFSANVAVIWSLPESAGSITEDGEYVSPASPGTFHVVATSRADPSRTAIAIVTVSLAEVVSISIDPASASIAPGGTLTFTSSVRGTHDTGVLWSVEENAGGTVADGVYTAPTAPGLYHVVVAAHADPSKKASAVVLVTAPPPVVAVRIDPATATLRPSEAVRFTAVVTGTSDHSVAWSTPDGGTVDSAGLFLAPETEAAYRVVATSRADPSKSATAVAIVNTPWPAGIGISPLAPTLMTGEQLQFTVTVTGLSDSSVIWSTDGGTIDQKGKYVAPAEAGTYSVAVQSVAGSIGVSTTVTVILPPPVVVKPAQYVIAPGTRMQMRASVPGLADQTVTWSVQEGSAGGSIDESGVYASPSVESTFHVIATSNADPTRKGVGTITTSWGNLKDFGGPLLPAAKVLAVWWGNPADFPSDARNGIEALLGGLNGTSYLAIADQYMRGEKTALTFLGSLTDTSAPPSTEPSNSDVANEVCLVLGVHSIAADSSTAYLLFTSNFPGNDHPSSCGWHSWATCQGKTVLVAYVPNAALTPRCQWQAPLLCNGASIPTQSIATVAVHELMEIITDPLTSSWYDDTWHSVIEIGDKCAWDFKSCVSAGGWSWQIQSEWSNAVHQCVGG